jgi:hypothetical protein
MEQNFREAASGWASQQISHYLCSSSLSKQEPICGTLAPYKAGPNRHNLFLKDAF